MTTKILSNISQCP